jgi:NAD+ synthase (glutamine-hydrolysing)
MSRLRIALAQINVTVGDIEGNVARIRDRIAEARDRGADLVAFPELAVCGYPPEDLLLKPSFAAANRSAIAALLPATRGIAAVLGFVERDVHLYNAAAVLHDGAWVGSYRKQRLPNYGVFDELRYFNRGSGQLLVRLRDAWVGFSICEDIWLPGGPVTRQARAGADVIVNINASPYERGKWVARHRMLATRASDHAVVIAYVNLVGGQDELVFDGDSMILGARGELLAEAPRFEEHLLVHDVELEQVFRARLHDPRTRRDSARSPRGLVRVELPATGGVGARASAAAAASPASGLGNLAIAAAQAAIQPPAAAWHREPIPGQGAAGVGAHDDLEEVYQALVLGTRDYVRKNGFDAVVIGLSGGIDSALVAAIAVDALGADCVHGVSLPSRYSSEHSRTDAQALATNLGIRMLTLPIEGLFSAALETLEEPFAGERHDLTEQNLQARSRGVLLMALSNAFGWMVLTTGNKSEMATGYSTLYGDMAGGFAVIKDVPKMLVYALSEWRNTRGDGERIPASIIEKPPSAELRPDQLDSDSLPPYEVLDAILEGYVEHDRSATELVAAGYDEATVRRVIRMVDASEYKRRQSAPGVKITPRAFGKDRRLPITSGWRER